MPKASSGWSRTFVDPIDASGKRLTSLRDAATYITGLPAKTAAQPHWQLATKCLIDAADRGGILMLAELAMRKAIRHGRPSPERPQRKKRVKSFKIIR